MSDLINRRDAINVVNSTIESLNLSDKGRAFFEKIVTGLYDVPSVPSKPIVHGQWLRADYDKIRCDACEALVFIEFHSSGATKNYCPNCGAEMDGGGMYL